MKRRIEFKEENKLPLTFKYIELFESKNTEKPGSDTTYYLECKNYQTDFSLREKPYKPLTRLL